MREYIVPDTRSSTVPHMWVTTDGVNHWVSLDEDKNDPRGQRVDIYSHDIGAVIAALEKAKMMMIAAGARMEVEY